MGVHLVCSVEHLKVRRQVFRTLPGPNILLFFGSKARLCLVLLPIKG